MLPSMFTSRARNAGQNRNMKETNCFKNMAQFKYLATTVTNQNFMHEQI